MAIGNLTSQIFANVYLNELDRYMMHSLKPLAYMRYGDDFVSWWPDQTAAHTGLDAAERFLRDTLVLNLNEGTTCVQPSRRKLHFLGIELWPSGRRLDTRMRWRARRHLSAQNYASYHALFRQHQPKAARSFSYSAITGIIEIC